MKCPSAMQAPLCRLLGESHGKKARATTTRLQHLDPTRLLSSHYGTVGLYLLAFSMMRILRVSFSHTIAVTDKDHAVRRRVWDKAFSISSLKEYQGPIQTRLNQLRDYIRQREGKPLDLHLTMGYFVYDVMSDLAYGGGGDMILKNSDGGILHDLSETVGLAGIIKVAPWIRPIAELAPSAKTATQFRSFAKAMFMKRYQQFESEGITESSDV
jgi:cytochrome P450